LPDRGLLGAAARKVGAVFPAAAILRGGQVSSGWKGLMGLIAVAGEALIDLVTEAGGAVEAHPGGGPYNTARTLARLGVPVTFFGGLGRDRFGRLLRGQLAGEGVTLGLPEPSRFPTTLAVVGLDPDGIADYSFYLDGTAAADVSAAALRDALEAIAAQPGGLTAFHVGTLGLLMEPVGTAVERLVRDGVPGGALLLLDPNCRPGAAPDERAYRARIAAIAGRADIVKASTDDLAYLYPGVPAEAAAQAMLAAGPPLVMVTDGPRPARAFLPGTVLSAEVPAVTVADTIGAGDAFGGGFLGWWTAHGLGRGELGDEELVGRALRVAAEAAALTCARPGADPPSLADLRARGWWPDR
jgi:fructokinase